MERISTIKAAKQILGKNFIGPDELSVINSSIGIKVNLDLPTIPFSNIELETRKNEYLLVAPSISMNSGDIISINSLRNFFGHNSKSNEPSFYNQDWYLDEEFAKKPLEQNWILIRKTVFSKSRGIEPRLLKSQFSFPSAVQCAYVFFCAWFHLKEILWINDFIWCNDFDSNNDQIYVGRYIDPMGKSSNGFSVHRHLSLRPCYGSIEIIS